MIYKVFRQANTVTDNCLFVSEYKTLEDAETYQRELEKKYPKDIIIVVQEEK